MKDSLTADYETKEIAKIRKPIEIYKVWLHSGSSYWYYTSADIPITYGTPSHEYITATIKRGSINYDTSLQTTKCEITVAGITAPFNQYLASNPIEMVWVEVSKLFFDQSPYEKNVLFIGQIKDVTLRGMQLKVTCVGFEFYLDKIIPVKRFQLTCNHRLFDSKCDPDGTLKSSKIVENIVVTGFELDDNGNLDYKRIDAVELESFDDNYFAHGRVFDVNGNERMIVSSAGSLGGVGNIITRTQIPGIEVGSILTAYPGCDQLIATCRDKFDNVANNFSFPYIPIDNPAAKY